jgi:DNA-binding protein HU-beta
MNKGSLISAVAAKLEVKASEAKTIVEAFSDIVKTALDSGDEVTIPAVGKLKVQTRPARNGRNPATGVAIEIPAKRVVKFSPASEFNESFKTVTATEVVAA